MKLRVLHYVGLLALLSQLSACESIPFFDKPSDYKTAGRARPLEVPPDLTSVKSSSAYAVAGATNYSDYNNQTQEVAEQEPKVLADPKNVRMVKAGAQRWLIVNADADKIWPVVRDFWLEQGFAVRVENPQIGVMETEWLDADAIKTKEDKRSYGDRFDAWLDKLSGLADKRKFRTRLERGEQEGTTELYMTHFTVAGAPDNGKNEVVTQLGKIETGYRLDSDKKNAIGNEFEADLDAELLRRLMVRLGLDDKQAEQITASATTPKRAEVTKESDASVTLKVYDPFDRAWRRVGLALDRLGFIVEDRNRADGLYYIRYADSGVDDPSKPKKGVLSRLKFWGDDEPAEKEEKPAAKPEKPLSEKLKFWKGSTDKNDGSKQYQIQVIETEDGSTNVVMVTKEGQRNSSSTANRIISLLYDQLK